MLFIYNCKNYKEHKKWKLLNKKSVKMFNQYKRSELKKIQYIKIPLKLLKSVIQFKLNNFNKNTYNLSTDQACLCLDQRK